MCHKLLAICAMVLLTTACNARTVPTNSEPPPKADLTVEPLAGTPTAATAAALHVEAATPAAPRAPAPEKPDGDSTRAPASMATSFASAPSAPFSTSTPCPVTLPNSSATPSFRGDSPSFVGNFGNAALWTILWPAGTVLIAPTQTRRDGVLDMKVPWWRVAHGMLAIHGRRLDAPAPPLRADVPDGYGDSGFQASGLLFSSEGCWEVTGSVAGKDLTFVTRVMRLSSAL